MLFLCWLSWSDLVGAEWRDYCAEIYYQPLIGGAVMDNEKTINKRIGELKSKICYAENARDNYKETHPILSEANSFYIDALKLELNTLEYSEGILLCKSR